MPARFIHCLLFISALATLTSGCTTVPHTADEAYQQTVVRPQSDGTVFVRGPVMLFKVYNRFGYTDFEAVVGPKQTDYFQKALIARNRRGSDTTKNVVPREALDRHRREGTTLSVLDTDVKVFFPPYYFDGFLRRVDSVSKPATR
jgi:hypothetical protein